MKTIKHRTAIRIWLLLFTVTLMAASVQAQVTYEEQPVDRRDVCFLYAEFGLPNSENLKVVVFTSYIYRYKYGYGYSHPVLGFDGFRTRLINAFNDKVDDIVSNEFNPKAKGSVGQVGLVPHVKIEWAYKNAVHAAGTGPELYQTVTSATVFNRNVRDRILSDYRQKGYKIFQTTFEEHYDEGIEVMRLEEVEKLSSLHYADYRPGAIRELARRYQESSESSGSSSGGSLVIESSDNSSSNNNKSSSSKESSSSSKEKSSSGPTLSNWCSASMSAVMAAEGEAKKLINANNMDAWNKLIAACEYYFSYCGMDNYYVNKVYNEAKGYKEQRLQMFADGAVALINDVFTPHTAYGFGYTGLDFKQNAYSPTSFQMITFQLSRVKRGANIIGELGYVQSPNYIVGHIRKNGFNQWETYKYDTTRQKGFWFSFGFGPTAGFFKRHLVLNATAQWGGLFYKKNYADEMGLAFGGLFSGGALVRIGKVGLGVNYKYFLLVDKGKKGDTLDTDPESYVSNRELEVPYENWQGFEARIVFNFKTGERKKK